MTTELGWQALDCYTDDRNNPNDRSGRTDKAEAERHIRAGLSEVELELYDLLSKENMSIGEEIRVKKAISDTLDSNLPDSYDKALFSAKLATTYDHIYRKASEGYQYM